MVKQLHPEIRFHTLDVTSELPPVIIEAESDTTDYRISQIIKYSEHLNGEILRKTRIISKLKYIDFVGIIAEFFLNLMNLVIGIWGLYNPAVLQSTASVCVAFTAFSSFVRATLKSLMSKLEKNQSLLILSKSKLSQVNDKYNLAIKDGTISHEEFQNILEEFKKYEMLRTEILNK